MKSLRIDMTDEQGGGFFLVTPWPEKNTFWNNAYKMTYYEHENQKGYKRYRTVTVSKSASVRSVNYQLTYAVRELYRKVHGYAAYRRLSGYR